MLLGFGHFAAGGLVKGLTFWSLKAGPGMLGLGYDDAVGLLPRGAMCCCWTWASGMLIGHGTSLRSLDISGTSVNRRLTFANVPTKAKTRPALVHFSRVLLLFYTTPLEP